MVNNDIRHRPPPLAPGRQPSGAGVHHLAARHWPVLPEDEVRSVLPEGRGLVYAETGSGLRSTQSPLDQAQLEAMRVSQVLRLRLRLKRGVAVSPALALPDMERDRRIERIASLSRVPLLWDLERCIATLAGAATGGHFRQPLERQMALEEISALLEDCCPRRRGVIPRRKAKISVHSWTLTGTSRRVIRTQASAARSSGSDRAAVAPHFRRAAISTHILRWFELRIQQRQRHAALIPAPAAGLACAHLG